MGLTVFHRSYSVLVIPAMSITRAAAVTTEKKKGKWQPSAQSERNKLACSFNLDVTLSRTRGTSIKRGIDETITDETTEETPVKSRRLFCSDPVPASAATRGIFELSNLQNVFSKLQCPKCQQSLEVDFPSICVLSSCSVTCADSKCGFVADGGPLAGAVNMQEDSKHPRSTDFAANCLYVLGFICSGDGGKEAARLLGMLDLPNSASMEKTSFPTNHRRMSPFLEKLAEEALHEALVEEVRQVIESQPETYGPGHFQRWKTAVEDPTSAADFPFPAEDYPVLTVSYDMGWQKRSSG